jgi:hypothetical protein
MVFILGETMSINLLPISVPGMGAIKTAAHRTVFASREGESYLPGGVFLDGAKCADPLNTPDVRKLRAGNLLGKITSGGKYGCSIIGITGEAMTGAETDLTVAEAVGDEIVRRIGASGTFKLTGPPTANGTVRTVTVTYSAVAAVSGGNRVITNTAMGVADVWTLTAPAGQDSGFYQLEITTGLGTTAEVTKTTTSLAANADSATVDAALEALSNVGVSGVAAVYSDPTLTLTFASDLGPVSVRVVSDSTNDGGVFEGGWAAVHTTTGVDGRFVAGSFIQPTDGSETPIFPIPDGFPISAVDSDGTSYTTIEMPMVPIGRMIDSSQIINWPSDTSLQQWIVDQMEANGRGKYTFDHKY